nr:GGDEF domain-containing protein [Pseudomonas sp. RIT-PI-AD]
MPPYRIGHFLPPALLLLGGGVAGSVTEMSSFFVSLFNVMPTLVLLLGGAFCATYGRLRQVFLLLVVYLAYYQLDTQVDHYLTEGVPRDDAALVFHLCSLLLPLLYGLYGCWQERTHLLRDLLARSGVLLAVLGIGVGLAQRFPEALLAGLSRVYWPTWQSSLIQLAYPVFLLAGLALLTYYLRRPRPQHAAQLLGLLGALWMLPKVFVLPHALHAMSSLVMLALTASVVHEAYQMAYRDELTGLPGRRALNERLQRLGRNYVLAMVDVDHFKRFNDRHGHDVGDQVLRMVAGRLRRVGGGGKAYRYGGEEFTLVFAGASLDDCRPHLEAVRLSVERYSLQLRDKHSRPKDDQQGRHLRAGTAGLGVSVTVSIGAAERDAGQRSPDEVIKAADRALYAAKNAGRNRLSAHGQHARGAVRLRSPAG